MLLTNLATCLSEVDAEDGAGEGFVECIGWVRSGGGVVLDADVATEVPFEDRREDEGDTLNGDALWQAEGGDALAAALNDAGGFGCLGIERLSFAAGGTVTDFTIF
ncbi:hypothetical protein [Tunturiibacter gelidiferens]|uniref:hypothetical protein n=1 Tax=Tunturiibacter gelidiferens TaxID=3069689 RepID=UPI003D9BCAC2